MAALTVIDCFRVIFNSNKAKLAFDSISLCATLWLRARKTPKIESSSVVGKVRVYSDGGDQILPWYARISGGWGVLQELIIKMICDPVWLGWRPECLNRSGRVSFSSWYNWTSFPQSNSLNSVHCLNIQQTISKVNKVGSENVYVICFSSLLNKCGHCVVVVAEKSCTSLNTILESSRSIFFLLSSMYHWGSHHNHNRKTLLTRRPSEALGFPGSWQLSVAVTTGQLADQPPKDFQQRHLGGEKQYNLQ